ncbi:hypothetical protein I7I53_01616 [Histoplasma capsulatum var. duboisii H88]|uniref:Uncharacterized protein n=2 Tax=Ajellomyces capsulatus TaxID=5037 RepID=A0A8A1LID8_AJEC8|nr:predicted protein [Histoplasma capsulatum H143]QSS54148.1 hypothetical protein I7I53_01616 [Histoplasma capsulatum var. duboisii H88]
MRFTSFTSAFIFIFALARPFAWAVGTKRPPHNSWEWCGVDISCNNDFDCRDAQDCLTLAGGDIYSIYCGTFWWPHSCWVYVQQPPQPTQTTTATKPHPTPSSENGSVWEAK